MNAIAGLILACYAMVTLWTWAIAPRGQRTFKPSRQEERRRRLVRRILKP